MRKGRIEKVIWFGRILSAVMLLSPLARAATNRVFIDPSIPWNGYENLYYQNGSYWRGDYFAPGTAAVIQGSITSSGIVTCAPDLRMDRDFHFDTNAWADASGSSTGICNVISTFYLDSTTIAAAGDTVLFAGTFVTNTLVAPYSNSIVAFIKDFDSNWGFNGMTSLNLNTLSNRQQFAISRMIVATGDHVQWGFEWSGPPARSNTAPSLGAAILAPLPPSRGAVVPWTTYEAEDMTNFNGTLIGPQYQANLVGAESSGRRCVRLSATGQFVEFGAIAPANTIVVRYSVPDTADGVGTDSTLSLYKNGAFVQKLALTSRYSWLYGAYPFNNLPASGSPRNFYDEVRLAGLTINTGDTVRLQKDADDSAAYYTIDLVDLESVAAPLNPPANSLSVTNYGAVPDGVTDSTTALRNCISAAQAQGKKVWLPAGTYLITGNVDLPPNTTLQGAGMWQTRLVGSPSLYNTNPSRRINLNGTGSNIHLSDFAVSGLLNYRNDTEGNDGLGGSYGTGSTISRIWVEHTKAAAWILNSQGLVVDNCRFRNTLADGINVNLGMRGTIVTNCTARGTGDDGFAIWPAPGPQSYLPGLNVITHCTAQTPFLANGGAIYGGNSNRIEDCLFQDIVYDCGILISTTFPVGSNAFSGTTVAQRCDLIRCGNNAGLQLCLQTNSLSGIDLNNLNISASIADGLSIIAPGSNPGTTLGTLSAATMSNVSIPNYGLGYSSKHGLWARSDAIGSMSIINSTIGEYRDDSSHFTFLFLPPAQRILNATVSGTNVTLTYATTPGSIYHLEFASNLPAASWTIVPGSTTNATGSMVSFTTSLPAGSSRRFYRTVSP